jgi:DNA-binding response OmpR family regulator
MKKKTQESTYRARPNFKRGPILHKEGEMSISLMSNPKLQVVPTLVKGKILLVDDDSQDLSFYCMVLYKQGYKVLPCESYQEAKQYLETENVDFVVLSQGGPSFEGRVVLERAVRPDLRLPVLILARWVDMGLYTEAMSLGAIDYLEKTSDPSELLRAIKIHLRYAGQPWLARLEASQPSDPKGIAAIDDFPSFKLGGQGDC